MLVLPLAMLGTLLMVAAPWLGSYMVPALLTGLLCLTPQAFHLRAWNLVFLNSLSIIGYIVRLI